MSETATAEALGEAKHPLDEMADLVPQLQDGKGAAKRFVELLIEHVGYETRKLGFLPRIMDAVPTEAGVVVVMDVPDGAVSVCSNGETSEKADKSRVYPPEYFRSAKPFFDSGEIGSLSESGRGKFAVQALVSSMLRVFMREDEVGWKAMVDGAAADAGMFKLVEGKSFGYDAYRAATDLMLSGGRTPEHLLLSGKCYLDIFGDAQLHGLLAANNRGMIENGRVGLIGDVEVHTDYYRDTEHKLFANREFYLVGRRHGQFGDRDGLMEAPLVGESNIPGVGWSLYSIRHMGIRDVGTVVRGQLAE